MYSIDVEGHLNLLAGIVIRALDDLTSRDRSIREDADRWLSDPSNKSFITFYKVQEYVMANLTILIDYAINTKEESDIKKALRQLEIYKNKNIIKYELYVRLKEKLESLRDE